MGASGASCACIDPVGQAIARRADQSGLQRRQSLGDRRAGADRDAGLRRRDPRRTPQWPPPWRSRSRDSVARPASGTRSRRHGAAAATWIATTSSPGASAVRRTPVMNWRSGRRRRGRPRDLDLGVECQQAGHAVGRRRGVADVAGQGAGVLDLAAADLAARPASGRRTEGGRSASRSSLQVVVAPSRQPAGPAVMPRKTSMPPISSTSSSIARPTRAG